MSAESTTIRERLDPRTMPLRQQLGIVAFLGLGSIPLVVLGGGIGSTTQLFTLMTAMYIAMFAMSWDAVSGYTGEISFGHAMFFAAGGYTSGILNLELGLSPYVAIPFGVVAAAILGLLIGIPALRLHGPYLSLITLVVPLVMLQIFVIRADIFGGEIGISNPDNLFQGGSVDLASTALGVTSFEAQLFLNFYATFALFAFILGLLLLVTRSDAGQVFTAIREDINAVESVGINPAKFKIFAFVLSGAVGGLAGAVFVHTMVGQPQPSQLLDLVVSIEVIIATIIGGMGTITGAAIGGLFFYLAIDFLSGIDTVVPILDHTVGGMDFLIFTVIALALLFYVPEGMLRWGIIKGRKLQNRVRERRGKEPLTDGGVPEDIENGTTPLERAVDAFGDELERIADRINGGNNK
mgnify:CR=1 FL=1